MNSMLMLDHNALCLLFQKTSIITVTLVFQAVFELLLLNNFLCSFLLPFSDISGFSDEQISPFLKITVL